MKKEIVNQVIEVFQDMWILDYVTQDRSFLSGKFAEEFKKRLLKKKQKAVRK